MKNTSNGLSSKIVFTGSLEHIGYFAFEFILINANENINTGKKKKRVINQLGWIQNYEASIGNNFVTVDCFKLVA